MKLGEVVVRVKVALNSNEKQKKILNETFNG